MMNEEHLILMEKCLDGSAVMDEIKEFEELLKKDSQLKNEYEEQLRVKEVLKKMQLKNPTNEVWDGYWEGIYNRFERSVAWLFISIGGLILLAIGSYELVSAFLQDSETPPLIKYSIAAVIFGLALLLFSVIRERLFLRKSDKYKEIQR